MEESLNQILNELKSINTRLDKIENRLDNMDSRFDKVENRLDNMDSRLDNLEKGQKDLKLQFEQFESKNAERHLELNRKIDDMANDISFIKHKEFKNEEDIFKIKKNLEIIK